MSVVYREIRLTTKCFQTSSTYSTTNAAHVAAEALTVTSLGTNSITITITFKRITGSTFYEPTAAYCQDWDYQTGESAQNYITADDNMSYEKYGNSWDATNGFDPSDNSITGNGIMGFTFDLDNATIAKVLTASAYDAIDSTKNNNRIVNTLYLILRHTTGGNYRVCINEGTQDTSDLWIESSDSNGNVNDNDFTFVDIISGSYKGVRVAFIDKTYSFSNVSGPNCVDKDTNITCLVDGVEKEVKVHNLKPGDVVKTYKDGYRKINRIGYMDSFNQSKSERLGGARFVLLKTDQNGLTEDLYVSARHLILVDSLTKEQEKSEKETFGKIYKVNDKFLVQARHHPDFELIEEPRYHRYYQMTLDNDGDIHKRHGIFTNGYLTESTCQYDYETHLTDLKDVVA